MSSSKLFVHDRARPVPVTRKTIKKRVPLMEVLLKTTMMSGVYDEVRCLCVKGYKTMMMSGAYDEARCQYVKW